MATEGPGNPEHEQPTMAEGSPAISTSSSSSGAAPAPVHPSDAQTFIGTSPSSSDAMTMAEPVSRPSNRPGGSQNSAIQFMLIPGMILSQRYEILKVLGEGGMGAVYKAQDRELDRLVALKVIRPELAQNPDILQRFKQEILLASRVTDRNIIRIYDLGDADGIKFITMEYVEGEDLRSLLQRQGKLPVQEAVSIIEQVLSGLQCAHREGIIHRDLKPGNIMRDTQGRVVVMDFGLARVAGSDGMTRTGLMIGTMEYMSPEQAHAKDLDARSDIFTTGLILYELLTGRMPYEAESAVASLVMRTQQRAIPISDLDRQLPAVLSNIVSRCLERDPALRYQSASEVLDDLHAWQGKGGKTRISASPTLLMMNRMRGYSWKWPVAAFVAMIVLLSGMWYWARNRPSAAEVQQKPVSVLVADFQNATSDSIFDGTLEPAFNLDLEGASFITAYNRGDARKIAAELRPGSKALDEALARLVAMREQVGAVVSGAIVSEGSGYRISAKAVDTVTGKVIGSGDVSVKNKDEVLKSVGKLAAAVRRALGDATPESTQILQTVTYSSGSLEASHQYAVAKDLEYAGKWEEATKYYERAIQLDPEMGRAYAALGDLNANQGRRQEGEKYYQMAMARFDRMSDREKYRTRAEYFLMMREPKEAIQEYESLVRQYPGDTSVYANMALAHFYTRNMPMALQEGRKAVEYAGKSLIERNNLALYAIYAGDFGTGEKEARAVLDQQPSYLAAYSALAMALVGEGKLDEAKQVYEKLEAQSPRGSSMAKLGLADLALYQAKPDEAILILQTGINADLDAKDNSAAAAKLIAMAQAEVMAGRNSQASAAADRALSLDKQESVAHAAGLVYTAVGQFPKALTLVSQMNSRVEPEPQLYAKLLAGEISLKKGDAKQAIAQLKDAEKISDTWVGHFTLGRAYLEANAFPEADGQIEECVKRRGEASALYLDDLPTFRLFPATYYYLGRVQDGMKNPAAAESYKTFLSIQGKGTGPLLADARTRSASR